METTRKKRRSVGEPTTEAAIYPTADDITMCECLYRYRYLSPALLALLIGKKNKLYTRERIRVLAPHGYFTPYNEMPFPLHWDDFYCLGKAGHKLVNDQGGMSYDIIHKWRKQNELGHPNFLHDYSMCNAGACIETGLRKDGYRFIPKQEIIQRANCKYRLGFSIKHPKSGNTLKSTLVPDDLFGFEKDGEFTYFACELERGNGVFRDNLSDTSFLKKLLAYKDIEKTKLYKSQYQISNMRILFIAKSEARMNTMISLTKDLYGKSNQFLFSYMEQNKPTPALHLYAEPWQRAGLDSIILTEQRIWYLSSHALIQNLLTHSHSN